MRRAGLSASAELLVMITYETMKCHGGLDHSTGRR